MEYSGMDLFFFMLLYVLDILMCVVYCYNMGEMLWCVMMMDGIYFI